MRKQQATLVGEVIGKVVTSQMADGIACVFRIKTKHDTVAVITKGKQAEKASKALKAGCVVSVTGGLSVWGDPKAVSTRVIECKTISWVAGTAESAESAESDASADVPNVDYKAFWVSILREWYVMSEKVFEAGQDICVEKRDGTTTWETVCRPVGTFNDSYIYSVRRDGDDAATGHITLS